MKHTLVIKKRVQPFVTFFVTYLFLLSALLSAQPSQAETLQGSASVTIQNNIQITEKTGLNYGAIATNGQADTVTLSPEGALSSVNGSQPNGGAVTSGTFNVIGTPDTALYINFVDGTLTGNGDDITIANFKHNAGTLPRFDFEGTLEFGVGADISINENQASGNYSGTYQVNLNYN